MVILSFLFFLLWGGFVGFGLGAGWIITAFETLFYVVSML